MEEDRRGLILSGQEEQLQTRVKHQAPQKVKGASQCQDGAWWPGTRTCLQGLCKHAGIWAVTWVCTWPARAGGDLSARSQGLGGRWRAQRLKPPAQSLQDSPPSRLLSTCRSQAGSWGPGDVSQGGLCWCSGCKLRHVGTSVASFMGWSAADQRETLSEESTPS